MKGHLVKTINLCLLKACWHTVFGRFDNYHLKKSHSVCIKNQNIQNKHELEFEKLNENAPLTIYDIPELFFSFFTAWNAQPDELAEGSNTWWYTIYRRDIDQKHYHGRLQQVCSLKYQPWGDPILYIKTHITSDPLWQSYKYPSLVL